MASDIRPARQGAIDGLCGVYAVINACRLLAVTGDERIAPEVRWDQTHRLFQALCMSDETRDLFPQIVCAGTREHGLQALLHVAQRWASRHSRVELTFSQPQLTRVGGAKRFFAALRDTLKAGQGERKAYILGIAQPFDHWTVVRRIVGDKVIFFDSGRFPSARKRSAHSSEFTFDRNSHGAKSCKRHVIDPASSYLLTSRYR